MPGKMPAENDKTDRRCALIENGCTDGKVTDSSWCHGCSFYVCDGCSINASLGRNHDVMEHADEEDES